MNKNVSDERRLENKKFVDYFGKLLSVKVSGNKTELRRIEKFLSAEKSIRCKDWLLEKIEELY